jgi:uncharacterized protein
MNPLGALPNMSVVSPVATNHPRLEKDYRSPVVDAALASAAAPAYFPTHRIASGTPLIDGGMWANNPIAVALVEAVGILKWPADGLRVLSLGCTTAALNMDWGKRYSLGKFGWSQRLRIFYGRTIIGGDGNGTTPYR